MAMNVGEDPAILPVHCCTRRIGPRPHGPCCGPSGSCAVPHHFGRLTLTTLIGWVAVDQRGPSSLYFAADSRFSWTDKTVWDYGRKLFASRTTAEVLAYCGDVIYASTALGQALQLIEGGLLYLTSAPPHERLRSIECLLRDSWKTYPLGHIADFTVAYACRVGSGMMARFFVAEIGFTTATGWNVNTHSLHKESDVVIASGSGRARFRGPMTRWKESDAGRTSRAVYSAFCDHLKNGSDPRTGGAPQLVGLLRDGPAITFGVVFRDERWVSGIKVPVSPAIPDVAWRDELFQRCDGHTLRRLEGAQIHTRPRGV
jgi:hypothetical protein